MQPFGCASGLTGGLTRARHVYTSPLNLDGATQAVGRPEPPVILDRFTGTGDGLVLDSGADGSEIRNLEIRSVSGSDFAAIRILGASGVHVSANVLGSNAGSLSMNEVGIVVSTSGNLIGGFSPSDRNIIGGNGTGVLINNGAFDNTVAGNYFGVDSSGTVRLPNVNAGISIENGSNNTIGGSNDAARNVITSSLSGIVVSKPSRDNHIERNYVGTTPEGLANPDLRNVQGIVVGGVGDNVVVKNLVSNNGTGIVVVEGFNQLIQGNIIGTNPEITRAVPNGIGISILNITDVADLRVGGAIAGEGNRICGNTNEGNGVGGVSDGALVIGEENAGNVIANNGGWGIDIGGNATVAARAIQFNSITNNVRGGIRLRDNSRETIRRNSIGRNGGLGIDLAGDGVTLNDSGDGDTGANARQNFPVLSSFTSTSSQLSIRGTLNSTPNTTFTIDVYSSLEADPTTFGEGETWLTSLTTRTDAGGNASFTAVVPAEGNTLKFITATATDPAGNTSEFSKAFFTGPSGPPKHRAVRH